MLLGTNKTALTIKRANLGIKRRKENVGLKGLRKKEGSERTRLDHQAELVAHEEDFTGLLCFCH